MSGPRRKPRIGVDFHTFDGIYQGSRSHILGVYGRAIAMAPDFDFVFFLHDVDALRTGHPEFAAPNVELVAAPHAGGLARLGWQLPRLRLRHRIDLLHMQYRLPFVPLGPCACTIHDTLFESHPQFFTGAFTRMSRLTSRRAARQAAVLFTVSEFSRGEIARLYGIDPARIAVTFNGIDGTRFRPGADGAAAVRRAGLEAGGYLCTIGRLEPRKNHLNLVRAYAQLPQPRPPLVVIGQRDFHSAPIFAAVEELDLAGEVRFLESVSDTDLPHLLRHAAVFAYPSFAEGFGMPVIEALASGVPTVTSNTTALPEVAGDAALMADPHDPADIARAIQRLLQDEFLQQRVRQRGLQQAARFNWDGAAATLVAAFRNHFADRVA